MTLAEIKKLRERMAELATEARAKLDTITEDTGADEAKEIEGRFDEMMADHDKIAARVEREERLHQAERRGMPQSDCDDEDMEGRDSDDEEREIEYREVFTKAIRFGVSSLDAEERGLLQTNRADLPDEVRAQAVGTDAAGGYTVPEDFSYEIDKALAAWGPMWDADIVREYATSDGRKLPWPTVDDTAARGRTKAENAPVDDDGSDDVAVGGRELDAFVYDTGMVRIPIELLQDSAFNIEGLMDELFAERLGRTCNDVLTNGSGTGEPNGIANAASVGVTAVGTAAITADEVIDFLHSVDPAYRMSPRCRWQFSDSTMAYIRKLKDGQGNYLWQMGDVRSGEPSRLLDHPYSINQAMPDIATGNKAMIFGDHSRYVVRKVMGFMVLTLRERYAERFQVGMVGFKRFDGELLNTAAVKALQLA